MLLLSNKTSVIMKHEIELIQGRVVVSNYILKIYLCEKVMMKNNCPFLVGTGMNGLRYHGKDKLLVCQTPTAPLGPAGKVIGTL